LSKEGGSHKREYIFVDDGSNDNSFLIIKSLKSKLPGEVKIIKRRNMGASYSTNEAIYIAKGYWIRLLDGDDKISYQSTSKMLLIARQTKVEFIYGLIHEDKVTKSNKKIYNYRIQTKKEGLKKFIKNCPANSSCVLVSVKRFLDSGGCDENFVSPDQVLFLRLFASGRGVFVKEIVARMPIQGSSVSLSSQIRRSRYESILALIRFCEENKGIDKELIKMAFKRSLSRANTYNKFLNKQAFSIYLILYLVSKFYFPSNYLVWMYRCLKVFTKMDINKPRNWLTGFEKKITSKKQVNQY
tara:strand:- start:279 stop:1175 length:897 start_codon:yes stop_codon:yes gene_type:complete